MTFQWTKNTLIQQLKRRKEMLKQYRANTTKNIIKIEIKIKRLEREDYRGRPKK